MKNKNCPIFLVNLSYKLINYGFTVIELQTLLLKTNEIGAYY